MTCYELKPLDTLFFRGSKPMEAGQGTSASLFPPPVSVVEGAFRTELLKQSKAELNRENGEKIKFKVLAILVRKDGETYATAPATWYAEIPKQGYDDKHFVGGKIREAAPLKENALGIRSSEGAVPVVAERERGTEAKPLAGTWIRAELLSNGKAEIEKGDLLIAGDIYSTEARTGIELDSNKHTKEGQIYSASHIRLIDDVSLVFCLDSEPKLGDKAFAENGRIRLGGEMRFCSYKKIDGLPLPQLSGEKWVCLAPVEASKENVDSIISSAKLVSVSGWDLDKGFHKPSTNWIPAGAVFSKNISGSCFAVADRKEK